MVAGCFTFFLGVSEEAFEAEHNDISLVTIRCVLPKILKKLWLSSDLFAYRNSQSSLESVDGEASLREQKSDFTNE